MKKNKSTEIDMLQLLSNTLNAAKGDELEARGKQKMLSDLIEFFSQPGIKVYKEETVDEPEVPSIEKTEEA